MRLNLRVFLCSVKLFIVGLIKSQLLFFSCVCDLNLPYLIIFIGMSSLCSILLVCYILSLLFDSCFIRFFCFFSVLTQASKKNIVVKIVPRLHYNPGSATAYASVRVT
jgi:hypothetical protein